MKLYTEEQVRRLIEGYYDVNWIIQDAFDELEPIELPSDEEMEEMENKLVSLDNSQHKLFNIGLRTGINYGVNWIKEQILNQNK